MRYLFIIMFLITILLLSVYYQFSSNIHEHYAEKITADEEYIKALNSSESTESTESAKLSESTELSESGISFNDVQGAMNALGIRDTQSAMNASGEINASGAMNASGEINASGPQAEGKNKFTKRNDEMNKLRDSLKSSHEMKEKSFEFIKKNSVNQNTALDSDIFDRTTHYEFQEGEYSGINKCRDECDGHCLEFGYTGHAWCFQHDPE